MLLNRLILRNFKKYRRATIEFQEGLTGIVGSNGSGKSTIVEAIAWALYGNKASLIKRDLIKNTHANDTESVDVTLCLKHDNKDIKIFRSMKGKNFSADTIFYINNDIISSGTRDVDKKLEEILNISYQDFMKTFYARQKDLDNLLKEGGTGKREYLLKLLNLDDIRELAIEQIRSDRFSLEEQKNRLVGALAEIGDVEARQEDATLSILLAEGDLKEAERVYSSLEEIKQKSALELEIQAEKMRTHELLAKMRARLEPQSQEKREAIKIEQQRQAEIESSKKKLLDLEPKLERLAVVTEKQELLEPKRKAYEETIRQMAACSASLEGIKRAIQEDGGRLMALREDAALLEELKSKEKEHEEAQAHLESLESQRDKHAELQKSLTEETARLGNIEENLARTEVAVKDLLQAKARLLEIVPCRKEARRLEEELKDLAMQRERRNLLESLTSRREVLETRKGRAESEAAKAHLELEDLGSIKDQEVALQSHDRELDKLGADLNNGLADLLGELKVQEKALLESDQSLKKVMALGEKSVCPTCERPLEGQSDRLQEKYNLAASKAKKKMAELGSKIKTQMEMIDGVTTSRSNLRKAFDDLNAKKSQRSALQADLRSQARQISESQSELKEILAEIENIGEVQFDLQKMVTVEAALNDLAPLIEECSNLAIRIEDLPRLEVEIEHLQMQKESHKEACHYLDEKICTLGYVGSEHAEARKKLAKLKPLHDRFLFLREKVQEIPSLGKTISMRQEEQEQLIEAMQEKQRSLQALGFEPSEYEALQRERKILSMAYEAAQKIQMKLATEPEIKRRLEEAMQTFTALEKDLASIREELAILRYSSKEHEAARLALVSAEMELELARKEISDKKAQFEVKKSDLEHLKEAAKRKKDHERILGETGRRLEVVDTTRSLINDFMDQVLIRVRNDIAKTAGEILEEVSGKYSLLKIDDDFNILVEDGGEFYPISRYSGGEIDMIAVSVRVAISEYLMRFGPEGETYSFLIFDEIFGSQDQEHREKMIQMLRSLEQRFPQIIAISHISDVQGQFDNTLQVVEDEMGNSRVEAL